MHQLGTEKIGIMPRKKSEIHLRGKIVFFAFLHAITLLSLSVFSFPYRLRYLISLIIFKVIYYCTMIL